MATKKRKANVVDTTAELRNQMKKNGVRLPHGYSIVKRKPAPKKTAAKPTKRKTVSPAKKNGVSALKKINVIAKRLQSQNPSMSWNWCIKTASKEYRKSK